MGRKEARDIVFKLVFEMAFHSVEDGMFYDEFKANEDIDDDTKAFVDGLYMGVIERYDEMVELVKPYLRGYTVDRIYKVDLSILVLACYELKYTDTDKKIVINEAVNLSKKYSSEKSYIFINGVLAEIVKSI